MLTWPEGNYFLAEHLRRQAPAPLQTNTLAYDLRETATGVEVLTYNTAARQSTRVRARRVLLGQKLPLLLGAQSPHRVGLQSKKQIQGGR
ncbi:hypothetical protein [Hymenobacter coccineus]|uniref:hypothetical protein n=1 Tax=Hymenobacter coccineus TaxID=1908235 RepID=UPI000A9D1FB7|nr:hypothetical protein [Hymenobacter coccineus]